MKVRPVRYQSDYILRMIEQLGGLLRRALEAARGSGRGEPLELTGAILESAFAIDPEVSLRLSPESLASLAELNISDDRIIAIAVDALELEGDLFERDAMLAQAVLRREQAEALRSLLDPSRAN